MCSDCYLVTTKYPNKFQVQPLFLPHSSKNISVCGQNITVDGRGEISEPNAAETSKMDCSFLESMQINWNKVQICTNSQKEQELKMPQKW